MVAEGFFVVRIFTVHFVDDYTARHVELIAVVPGDFSANFLTGNSVNENERTISNAQGRDPFRRRNRYIPVCPRRLILAFLYSIGKTEV